MRIDRVHALVVLGRAAVADHRWDDAAALLVGAADELDGRPAPSMYTVDAHAGPPELTADLLEDDHAAPVDLDAIAHRGLTVLRSYAAAVPIATPRLHLVNGRLEYLRGRHAAARRSFDRAGRTAERFGMPWEAQEAARRLAAIAQHR